MNCPFWFARNVGALVIPFHRKVGSEIYYDSAYLPSQRACQSNNTLGIWHQMLMHMHRVWIDQIGSSIVVTCCNSIVGQPFGWLMFIFSASIDFCIILLVCFALIWAFLMCASLARIPFAYQFVINWDNQICWCSPEGYHTLPIVGMVTRTFRTTIFCM